MVKSIKDVIMNLVGACDSIDDTCCVKIVRRNKYDVVTEYALVPISYFDSYDNICIEESQITWQLYHDGKP